MLADPQKNLISKTGSVCKALTGLLGAIQEIDVLYSGSPNWDALITDEELASIPSFAGAGLTATTVADAVYQIKLVRDQITTGNLPALFIMAQL